MGAAPPRASGYAAAHLITRANQDIRAPIKPITDSEPGLSEEPLRMMKAATNFTIDVKEVVCTFKCWEEA